MTELQKKYDQLAIEYEDAVKALAAEALNKSFYDRRVKQASDAVLTTRQRMLELEQELDTADAD